MIFLSVLQDEMENYECDVLQVDFSGAPKIFCRERHCF